ncbi:MAG TPA: alternative oxidase [Ilumatobacteraceae bacterium]|nr:alternative oxidase [Ilumatobacteraceae bacterium]
MARTMGPISEGPLDAAIDDKPPFGPMKRLTAAELRAEQQVTLRSPRRKPGLAAKGLFTLMDVVYGRKRTIDKFRVLELVARVPYQAWEHVAYVAVTHTAAETDFARRVFNKVRINRWEQDNEQWHLLILNEMMSRRQGKDPYGWLRATVIPQLIAFAYYQWSWLTYVIRPAWSYRLNADFEDHAEHEYAQFVEENPELETTPFHSEFTDDFCHYDSVADLFRQIGYDERIHKLQSIASFEEPRFR